MYSMSKEEDFLQRKGVKVKKRFNWRKTLKVSGIVIGLYIVVSLAVSAAIGVHNLSKSEPAQNAASQPVVKEAITPDKLLKELNRYRQEHGVAPLAENDLLNKSAALKCDDMAKESYYEHENPVTKKTGYSYIKDVGVYYNSSGENLNAGNFNNAREVILNWAESKPHKEAMLSAKYSEAGLAVCEVSIFPNGKVYVNHFIEALPEQGA